MDIKKAAQYAEDIVEGNLPDQETFTKEEVLCLAKTILSWASLQIDHTIDEVKTDDIPEQVRVCEFKSIEDAIEQTEQVMEEEFGQLADFIISWLD